jgi:uncharacterized protein (DUF58 family)
MRAAEWAAWTRTLPWRIALILGVGAAGGVFGSLLAPRLSLVLGTLAAVAAGAGLRFRPSPDAKATEQVGQAAVEASGEASFTPKNSDEAARSGGQQRRSASRRSGGGKTTRGSKRGTRSRSSKDAGK